MKQTNKMKLKVLLFTTIFFSLAWSQAASITKFKGTKVLIKVDGEAMHKGDEFYSVDSANKKKAIIRITTVKGNQALGQVLKGKPEVGHSLAPYKKSVVTPSPQETEMPEVRSQSALSRFGLLAGYLVNKMSAKYILNNVEKTTDMSGNGFGLLGYYDYEMSESLQLRGAMGVEQFQVSETRTLQDCDLGTSNVCNAIITYLSTYGLVKYNFINGYTKAWFGGGGGFLAALAKRSTVLDSSQISTNYVATVAGGFDVNMTQGQYLPVVFEYSFFPSSNTVMASYIAVRIGWGWR